MSEFPKTETAPEIGSDALFGALGYWVSVEDRLPDDNISVVVWSTALEDAALAHHDTEVLEKRGDSGWLLVGQSRVIIGVSHWCSEILPPNA